MVTYCTAAQVASFLQKKGGFSATTTPTTTDVEDLIERNEDYIDEETGHAWREKTVTDEYVDRPVPVPGLGMRFTLRNRSVKTITTGSGDKIEVFDGNSFEDYAATKTEGRASTADYFVDKELGQVYIKDRIGAWYPKGFRATYRYGEATVARDIEKACILLTAADIITMNDRQGRFPDDGPSNKMSFDLRYQKWKDQAEDILASRKELGPFVL